MTTTTTGPVDLARDVLANGIYTDKGKLKGMDALTAQAVTAVADAMSPENAAKLNAMSVERAVTIVWKLVKK